jgi:hypothetical protein
VYGWEDGKVPELLGCFCELLKTQTKDTLKEAKLVFCLNVE